jgi:trans-aconitate 2-methyltransferase
MHQWDTSQYLKYANERFRPAFDLIAQITLESPNVIYDLGCGTGHITKVLADRWREARVIGIDSSAEMLVAAKQLDTKIEWVHQDITTWTPAEKPDLIFSNSVLQWVKNHNEFFRHLLDLLNPQGMLAIQMPNNFEEPSHAVAFNMINENSAWKNKFLPFVNHDPIHDYDFYYDVFSENASTINLWETTYFHILEGKNAVTEWVKGSFLRPILEQMSSDEKNLFLSQYENSMALHYPSKKRGKTILPFKRLFLVVKKN